MRSARAVTVMVMVTNGFTALAPGTSEPSVTYGFECPFTRPRLSVAKVVGRQS